MDPRRRPVAALMLAAALLTACQLRSTTTIGASGAGEFRTEIGFTPEERQRLEQQGASPDDFCGVARTPAGTVVLEEQRGEETWCINVQSFADLAALRDLYAEEEGITVNRLEITEDRLHYDLTLDTSSPDSSLSGFSSILWTLDVPGTVLEHNGTDHSDRTVSWELSPGSGTARLVAESTLAPASAASRLLVPIGAMAVLGIGLVLGAMLLARLARHRSS